MNQQQKPKKPETYDFREQHIVVAYCFDEETQKDRVGGVFITYPGESFTKEELLDYFFLVKPEYLVAVEISGVEDLSMDNYTEKLEPLINDLYECNLDDLAVNHYIPATIH